VLHEVPAGCVPAACAALAHAREVRVPRAWGGGDEPLYEWYTVISVSVCDAGAYRYVVIERYGECLRAFDYVSGKEVAGDVEDFEPHARKCFKVATSMGAEELARLLLSHAEEVGWKPRVSPLPFKGIFAEFFLDTVAFHFHGVNLFEVELDGGKVRVNGREFRVRAAEGYVEELEAARTLARSWQATVRELAEELEREPRAAERRLQRLLEDLAGKV
jgi:hypothetical protein